MNHGQRMMLRAYMAHQETYRALAMTEAQMQSAQSHIPRLTSIAAGVRAAYTTQR